MIARRFLDTNILIYSYTDDPGRTPIARRLLADGGLLSVQVCNEFVSVAFGKLRMAWPEIEEALRSAEETCGEPVALTPAVQRLAFQIARSDQINIYDANIVAAAQLAGCTTLVTEDLQNGRRFGALTVRNPFAG